MTRSFGLFLLRFSFLYAVVIVPWPGLREAYGDYFRSLGNMVYEHHGGAWTAFLEPCRRTKGFASMDSQIVLYANSAVDQSGNVRATFLGIDSRSIGWLPMGLTLALIAAVPLPLRRRIIALLIGGLFTQCYVLVVIGIYLLNRAPEAGIFSVPPWFGVVSDALEWTFVTQLGPGFVIPVLIALGAVQMAAGKETLKDFVRKEST